MEVASSLINIVLVSNKPLEKMKTLETLHYPFAHRLIISRAFGFGNARNVGALACGSSGLMVQLNDDLVLSPMLWDFALSVKQGEFAFQVSKSRKAGDQPCSRVFIIHIEDFWRVGGCDGSLKYFFEDGDFYHRAIQSGLKFRHVSGSLAVHLPHVHAFYNPSLDKMAKIEFEVCRVFVKYKRNVNNDVVNFFVPFKGYRVGVYSLLARYRIGVYHLLLRLGFTLFWILRSPN